jgi:2-haloacid dehalogenase/putative hydrolase of the HAD superfamily
MTFDCYGTLIDWETGIRDAFHRAMSQTGASPGLEAKAFELYEEEERRVERERPHLLYRDVLAKTSSNVAKKIGWKLSESQSNFLVKELPTWTPFLDTNRSLEKLSRKYTLGILSNVDNDLLAGTLKHLTSPFEIIVTAENVMSYKPAPAHFEEARKNIGERSWIHVAASRYHDIAPAARLGIKAVWVNRKNTRSTSHYSKTEAWEVNDLDQLVRELDSARAVRRIHEANEI